MKNKRTLLTIGLLLYIFLSIIIFIIVYHKSLCFEHYIFVVDALGKFITPLLHAILIYITWRIAKRIQKNEAQRHINQFRYAAYEKLCSMFLLTEISSKAYLTLQNNLKIFSSQYNFLFDEKKEFDKLVLDVNKSIDPIIVFFKSGEKEDENSELIAENVTLGPEFESIEEEGIASYDKKKQPLLDAYNVSHAKLLSFVQENLKLKT